MVVQNYIYFLLILQNERSNTDFLFKMEYGRGAYITGMLSSCFSKTWPMKDGELCFDEETVLKHMLEWSSFANYLAIKCKYTVT